MTQSRSPSRSFLAVTAAPPLVAALNHLLAQEPWATDSLRPFAGKAVRFDAAPLGLTLRIEASGLVAAVEENAEEGAEEDAETQPDPAVTLTVPLTAGPNMAVDYAADGQAGVMKYVRIEGEAELANAISFLVRHLRWDAAEDLSRVVGDVAAHRAVEGARQLRAQAERTGRGLLASLTEYLIDEQPTLVRRTELDAFAADVAEARDDVARFEKRLERLERNATSHKG
jgi:ubiquinone biosynthesis protein UbiJ